MIAVWSLTGRPFRVGDRTFDPFEATLVERMDKAMSLQSSNLRTLEVEGPGDPKLLGVKLRDANGEAIEPEIESVPVSDHNAVVKERDDVRTENETLKADAEKAIKPEVLTSLTKERDDLQTKLDKATGDLSKAVSPEDHKAVVDELTEANKKVEKLTADNAKLVDPKDLAAVTKERDGLKTQVEKLTADLATANAKPK